MSSLLPSGRPAALERGHVAPQGLFGGLEGACFKSTITRTDGSVPEMPSKASAAVVTRVT